MPRNWKPFIRSTIDRMIEEGYDSFSVADDFDVDGSEISFDDAVRMATTYLDELGHEYEVIGQGKDARIRLK